ncbi:MAG: hypothetical protein HYT37_02080 [Candidatus Sungbacteria bacterium]|nr:hypothetical protein [Candidatus Sungbacteria bacterium]
MERKRKNASIRKADEAFLCFNQSIIEKKLESLGLYLLKTIWKRGLEPTAWLEREV